MCGTDLKSVLFPLVSEYLITPADFLCRPHRHELVHVNFIP